FTVRRNFAQAIGMQRGAGIVLPALTRPIDATALDQETRRLTAARFDGAWAEGLKEIEATLAATLCPRKPEGARELAIRSYFPPGIVLAEPETLASNLFRVIRLPKVIHRFCSTHPVDTGQNALFAQWAFRQTNATQFLSFYPPPTQLTLDYG